jgi:hypothetical protein
MLYGTAKLRLARPGGAKKSVMRAHLGILPYTGTELNMYRLAFGPLPAGRLSARRRPAYYRFTG